MNRLAHLPEHKQHEILRIADIIKAVINPEMIILFGSYAKGKYVEHRYVSNGITYEYISDYDFLVVTKDNPENVYDQESRVMDLTQHYNPPVNLEIHEIDYVNKGLEWGEYFWVDIVKEGIVLFSKGTVTFSEPVTLTDAEKREKAQKYFDTWFRRATEFLEGAKFFQSRNSLPIADFHLHQVCESLYYSTLLVFTDYKPKTHNLWKLRRKAKPYSEELFQIFRTEIDKNDKNLFELLKQGYIDARYKEDFTITENELSEIMNRVSLMIPIAEKICTAHINAFTSQAP